MAINIMGQLNSENIEQSIIAKNADFFSTVSGVGNKLAIRIVNELYEKIKKKSDNNKLITTNFSNKIFKDLVSCLFNLGYPQNLCEKTAVDVINSNEGMSLEELIPVALIIFQNLI